MDPAIIVFGLGIGVLVGMTGMGGGSLMTPLLILIFGIQPTTAIGTDIFYSAVTKTVGGEAGIATAPANSSASAGILVSWRTRAPDQGGQESRISGTARSIIWTRQSSSSD